MLEAKIGGNRLINEYCNSVNKCMEALYLFREFYVERSQGKIVLYEKFPLSIFRCGIKLNKAQLSMKHIPLPC